MRPRPRAHCTFPWRLGNRLRRRIAKRQQNLPRAARLGGREGLQRFSKRFQAEIARAISSIHAIQKRGDIDELRARIHEVEIEQFLAGHGGVWRVSRLPARWSIKRASPRRGPWAGW